jgi:hypothetical protein
MKGKRPDYRRGTGLAKTHKLKSVRTKGRFWLAKSWCSGPPEGRKVGLAWLPWAGGRPRLPDFKDWQPNLKNGFRVKNSDSIQVIFFLKAIFL